MAEEKTTLIDEWIDAPDGVTPEKVHILFDKQTREFADQYASALHVARNIPFNINAIPVTDPMALICANVFRLSDGGEAIRKAQSYYEQWAYDAQKHGWTLALLEDNEFVGTPKPYESNRVPRGIAIVPEPKYDLNNPTEKRLKVIFDTLDTEPAFQSRVMAAINNAFARVVSEAGSEDTDERTGFQPESTGADVHDEVVASSDDGGKRSPKRPKNKVQSVSLDPVGEGQ